jgi:hypothetical protein
MTALVGPALAIPSLENEFQDAFMARVVDSFLRVTGMSLTAQTGIDSSSLGRGIYFGDFALLCHRGDDGAVLNYANAFAQHLWDADWDTLVSMPSVATAPPEAVASRAKLMDKVARDNFVADYGGVRVSRTGRLFRIKNATVWRLLDETGGAFGVGAYFRDYEFL